MTMSAFLSSPQAAAFASAVLLGLFYALVGKAGSGLEALGAKRGILALVVLGKRLEALGYDGPKLKGEPGAAEEPHAQTVVQS